jgi:ribosomal protein L37AE/L43A
MFRYQCRECGKTDYRLISGNLYGCPACNKRVKPSDFDLEDGERIATDEAGYMVIMLPA